jgi:hypothetical protein
MLRYSLRKRRFYQQIFSRRSYWREMLRSKLLRQPLSPAHER